MKILSNAFSFNMINTKQLTMIRCIPIAPEEVPNDVESAIGHPDTARVVSGILGFDIPCERKTVTLAEDDILYVAQYKGPRLDEGATVLPEGATLEFLEITLRKEGCSGCGAFSNECGHCGMKSWMCGM